LKGFIAFVAFMLLLGGCAAAAGWLYMQAVLPAPGPLQQTTLIYIEPGSSGKKIAGVLKEAGAIDDENIFRAGAFLMKGKGPLRAGEYEIKEHASTEEVIETLQSGKVYQRQLTIPEGLTSTEIVALLNAAEAMEGTVTATPPDGSLLPETYNYTFHEKRETLLERMKKEMQDTLAETWSKRAEGNILKSPEEAVVLASIVEKETGIAAERAKVAGVFYNRLKIDMPLQSDPTVIYAITGGREKLDRPLLRTDLNTPSPYNTYVTKGLPPTPIANPGRASLEAVMNPEAHEYIYFVADGTGGHAFAKTLAEHDRNVGKWRDVQKKNKN
jgi:UPF0755 protein